MLLELLDSSSNGISVPLKISRYKAAYQQTTPPFSTMLANTTNDVSAFTAESFDFVIVGGGTAGLAVASRYVSLRLLLATLECQYTQIIRKSKYQCRCAGSRSRFIGRSKCRLGWRVACHRILPLLCVGIRDRTSTPR